MGFPASGVLESKYRNDAREVADFLNRHFPNRYKVINLSERSYDYSLFHNQVRRRSGTGRPQRQDTRGDSPAPPHR